MYQALLRAGKRERERPGGNRHWLLMCLLSHVTGQRKSHAGHISGVGKDIPPSEVTAKHMATEQGCITLFQGGGESG